MTRLRMSSMFCVLILVTGVLPAAAQSLTLKLTGIKGSSTVEKDAIDIMAFGWSVTNASALTPDGPVAGKANASEFVLNLLSFDVLPMILQKLLSGDHVDEARITVWDASQKKMYDILFKNVLFGTLALSAQTGAPPSHSLTFSFATLDLSVAPGNAATFDFTQ